MPLYINIKNQVPGKQTCGLLLRHAHSLASQIKTMLNPRLIYIW